MITRVNKTKKKSTVVKTVVEKVKKEVSKVGELLATAKKLQEEIFALQIENIQKKLKDTSVIGKKKDERARILTAIQQLTK